MQGSSGVNQPAHQIFQEVIVEDEDENFNEHTSLHHHNLNQYQQNSSAIGANSFVFSNQNTFMSHAQPYTAQQQPLGPNFAGNVSSLSGGSMINTASGNAPSVKKSQNFESMQPLLNPPQNYSRDNSISPTLM